MKESINEQTTNLTGILCLSLDSGSYYAGCVLAYILYEKHPIKQINETKVGSFMYKHLPKGIWGSIICYTTINIYGTISFHMHRTHKDSITLYFVQKILIYLVTSCVITFLLCDGKVAQYNFVNIVSRSEHKFLLFSEIITYKIATSIGDIKIGPDNKTVVFLVAIGTISVIYKFVNYAEILLRDMLNYLDFK
ncbi:Hypothetical_protein [Hexamita inflata]|uniref:Hypothetical_protein n=1 Tax=Hexamita inflata TaxID=28002 RepID=A0AA86UXU6_9EUKA|nr:Hypothetical protein HINF_LOCUS56552 [Hexamita inflata]